MSIICHDLERSYKGVYLMAMAVPFFVTALIFIKSAVTRQSQSGVVPTDDIKIAVLLFAVSAVLTGCAIRILRFQYHILFDNMKGRFYYKKDNLLDSFKMEGELQQIKEIYVKKVSVPSDRVSRERRTLYKLGVQVAHQHIVLYISPMEKEALSMGQSLSNFLGIPFNQDVDDLE
jgi:hypothetical protein